MHRVKERLQNSLLPYETKFPILLNKNSLLVRAIIIFDCHRKVIPSGLKDTLNELRCNFWVIQGRRVVKSVIRKCLMLQATVKTIWCFDLIWERIAQVVKRSIRKFFVEIKSYV